MNIIFTRASFFSLFHFHHTLFRGLAGAYVNPEVFSFCAFTCLSNNSLISSWISAKLGLALPSSMLYLSYYFQLKENTLMCL